MTDKYKNFLSKIWSAIWPYHIVPFFLWVGCFLLPVIYTPRGFTEEENKLFLTNIFYSNLLLLALFYFHSYIVYPLLKRKWGLISYCLALCITFILYLNVSQWFAPPMPPMRLTKELQYPGNNFSTPDKLSDGLSSKNDFGRRRIFRMIPFFFILLCSYCYCMLIDNSRREREIKDRENVHLKTELSFLRSQISPHFIFNVFNSLVSLARKKSDLLEPSLINISGLMRYMLYEVNGNTVSLATEVNYLKNYIDLQLLRYGDSIHLNFFLNGKFEGYQMEPMLLIPFVENAFKHGTENIKKPIIDIFLSIDSTSKLSFIAMNSRNPLVKKSQTGSGIGLVNVKRRLELLYPGKHQVTISEYEELFKVDLRIDLV